MSFKLCISGYLACVEKERIWRSVCSFVWLEVWSWLAKVLDADLLWSLLTDAVHRMAVHWGASLELVGGVSFVHVTESNFREDHEASVSGLLVSRETLQGCFGNAVCEVDTFAEHVACLS